MILEFDRWAAYYDFVHQGLEGEAEFYVGQAVRMGGNTLELGCGTGRICIPMAMSGVAVTGLDISFNMLQLCQEKAGQVAPLAAPLTLLQADMQNFQLNRQFDFIAMPYRALMHLLSPQQQIQCLRRVHQHLTDKGVFIMNVWAARPSVIAPFLQKRHQSEMQLVGLYPVPQENSTLIHYHAVHYEEHTQIIREKHVIQEKDSDANLLHTEELTMTRTWFTERELSQLVQRAGFTIETILGDFCGTPFNAESPEIILVLRK